MDDSSSLFQKISQMFIQNEYSIPKSLIKEALEYSQASKAFTSDRHDFHSGGLNAKQQKMFEGKLGEKVFKMFLIENNIQFLEDRTPFDEADNYDFMLPNKLLIDVKTRTKPFHIRTLEMVEQFKNKPKDIYVSVRLFPADFKGELLGWFKKEDVIKINRRENQGYLDNYVIYDNELRTMQSLYEEHLINYAK